MANCSSFFCGNNFPLPLINQEKFFLPITPPSNPIYCFRKGRHKSRSKFALNVYFWENTSHKIYPDGIPQLRMVNPYGKYDELVKSQHHPSTVRSAQALRLTVRPEALEGTNGSLSTGFVEA
jgi:hypothetical protein